MSNHKLILNRQERQEVIRGLHDFFSYLDYALEEDKNNEINMNYKENKDNTLNLIYKVQENISKEEMELSSEEKEIVVNGFESTMFWIKKYQDKEKDNYQRSLDYIEEIKNKVQSA